MKVVLKVVGNVIGYLGLAVLILAVVYSVKYTIVLVSAPNNMWQEAVGENWALVHYIVFAFFIVTTSFTVSRSTMFAKMRRLYNQSV